MTFFDVINDILFHKKKNKLDNVDNHQHFVPFLINRWCSMYNSTMCRYINDTLNRYPGLFEDKQDMYKAYTHIIPRVKQKFIRYIKKSKKDESTEQDSDTPTALLAHELELSEREINMYIEYERQHRPTDTNRKPD